MLLPHQWAVLTVDEAELLVKFIEKATAIKGLPKNYRGIQKEGMLELHGNLSHFIECNRQYVGNLHDFDPSNYERADR